MGFFDRFSRLFRANLNDLLSKAEDPGKLLEQSVLDMQEDLIKLRQAVGIAIAAQNRLRSQEKQANSQIDFWYERAKLALIKGEEELAKEALSQRKVFQESSSSLSNQLEAQEVQVEKLKRGLVKLEGKIGEAKTKKDMLKARAQAAKASQQLQDAVGSLGANSAMSAFEKMEEKIQSLEASSAASAELAGSDLEGKFEALESSYDLDAELQDLRQELKAGPENAALPIGEKLKENESLLNPSLNIEEVNISELDEDLEQLKRSINEKDS